jgi:hypothetical protein
MAEQYVVSAVLGPFDSKEEAQEALNEIKASLDAAAHRTPDSAAPYYAIIGSNGSN